MKNKYIFEIYKKAILESENNENIQLGNFNEIISKCDVECLIQVFCYDLPQIYPEIDKYFDDNMNGLVLVEYENGNIELFSTLRNIKKDFVNAYLMSSNYNKFKFIYLLYTDYPNTNLERTKEFFNDFKSWINKELLNKDENVKEEINNLLSNNVKFLKFTEKDRNKVLNLLYKYLTGSDGGGRRLVYFTTKNRKYFDKKHAELDNERIIDQEVLDLDTIADSLKYEDISEFIVNNYYNIFKELNL